MIAYTRDTLHPYRERGRLALRIPKNLFVGFARPTLFAVRPAAPQRLAQDGRLVLTNGARRHSKDMVCGSIRAVQAEPFSFAPRSYLTDTCEVCLRSWTDDPTESIVSSILLRPVDTPPPNTIHQLHDFLRPIQPWGRTDTVIAFNKLP